MREQRSNRSSLSQRRTANDDNDDDDDDDDDDDHCRCHRAASGQQVRESRRRRRLVVGRGRWSVVDAESCRLLRAMVRAMVTFSRPEWCALKCWGTKKYHTTIFERQRSSGSQRSRHGDGFSHAGEMDPECRIRWRFFHVVAIVLVFFVFLFAIVAFLNVTSLPLSAFDEDHVFDCSGS